ncbi:hypothetical protein PENSPDRAFT_653526 [Peniophora sp. CONT]|nr:hypothetical protein PENSPDRAFT_653526 [Peniophora sp. CONT]
MFSWESPLLSVITLTELDIAAHSSLEHPTLEVLLAVLRRLPALKFIRLKNCLPSIAHRIAHDGHTRVEPPHLNHFELISGSPFALHAVAAHVRVPTSAKFLIQCDNYSFAHQVEFDEQHAQALADAVLSHVFVHGLHHHPRDGIHIGQHLLALCSDEITQPYESSLEFGTMRYSDSDDVDTPFDFMRKSQSWEPFIGLNLSWDVDFEPNTPYILLEGLTMRAYKALLSNIPLDLLKGVHIAGDAFTEPETFIRSFHSAKNVEALTLSGEVQSAALEVMSGLINFDDPLSSEPLFPSLKRLCICELPPDAIMMDGNTALTHLRATLQRRRDADQDAVGGLRVLDRLGLFHSIVLAALVEELGPLVTHGSVDLITAGDNGDGQ